MVATAMPTLLKEHGSRSDCGSAEAASPQAAEGVYVANTCSMVSSKRRPKTRGIACNAGGTQREVNAETPVGKAQAELSVTHSKSAEVLAGGETEAGSSANMRVGAKTESSNRWRPPSQWSVGSLAM